MKPNRFNALLLTGIVALTAAGCHGVPKPKSTIQDQNRITTYSVPVMQCMAFYGEEPRKALTEDISSFRALSMTLASIQGGNAIDIAAGTNKSMGIHYQFPTNTIFDGLKIPEKMYENTTITVPDLGFNGSYNGHSCTPAGTLTFTGVCDKDTNDLVSKTATYQFGNATSTLYNYR